MRPGRGKVVTILAACMLLGTAAVAFAYPVEEAEYTEGVLRTMCVDCHSISEEEILDPGEDPELVASVRKGPHGGYSTGTRKCQTCHVTHAAPAAGVLMLPGETIRATCESCHDGTGGTGVYGVIYRRTGVDPAATHSIETTNVVPGGDGVSGGALAGSFSGPGATLTCSDCHSPHDSQTVEPFTGDRLRAAVASDTAYAVKTNRLLRQAPTSAETTVAVYGTDWCASCHKGRASRHAEESGIMQTHPIMQDDEYYYDSVQVVASVGSTETTPGRMGQSNRGYVMPEPDDADAGPRAAPICQQCHEDARDVGPAERGASPMLIGLEQEFNVTTYPALGGSGDNPRFQVFPHESENRNFLVRPIERPDEASLSYQLCLNCHSMRHDVPEEYAWCVSAGCHDDGDAADIHEASLYGCLACHEVAPQGAAEEESGVLALAAAEYTPQLTLDCGTLGCHDADPHSHRAAVPGGDWILIYAANEHDDVMTWDGEVYAECTVCHSTDVEAVHGGSCATCHPTPYDTLDPGWALGCQEGGCHESYHTGARTAHWSVEEDCNACHDSGWAVTSASCSNCHASPGNAFPPVTTSDALSTYIGPARIRFSVTEGGKIAVGWTYYRIGDGPIRAGSTLELATPGTHALEFWSVDQEGNVETPRNTASVTIIEDTTPPVTTSNAQSAYFGNATITLTATDDSFLGVKNTYYSLDGGPVQTGTRITVPATSGTVSHTLQFWSDDYSGNVESPNTVDFTVTGGTGTIRLIWDGWGNVSGSPGPVRGAMSYKVWQGSVEPSGGWVHRNTDDPTWEGVDDVVVNVSGQSYRVRIWCLEEDAAGNWVGEDDFTASVLVDEAGKVVRLLYWPY